MANNFTQQQIRWITSQGLDPNDLSKTQFNYRLPDGTVIPAAINPGSAATIQVPNYTTNELYKAANDYLNSIGAVQKNRSQVPGLSPTGPTNVWVTPEGRVLEVGKDFYENLGREQLEKAGNNVVQAGVFDRSTQLGQSIASQYPATTVDPQKELAKALAETPLVPQGTVYNNQSTVNNRVANPQLQVNNSSIQPPSTYLQPGQSSPEVKQLQDFLVSKGFMTSEQVATGPGIYGPQTTAAVKAWQEANGVDNSSGPGYWGPKSIAVATGTTTNTSSQMDQLNAMTETLKGMQNRVSSVKTDPAQPFSDAEYESAKESHPLVEEYKGKGNSMEAIDYAIETGDISGLVNQYGKPFSFEEQQAALAEAQKDLELFYKTQQEKETADTEAALADKKRAFQESLISSGENFSKEKTALDQAAVDQGVLFSGSRAQKEQDLKNKYEREQASNLANLSSNVGNLAREYQYKYGNEAANKLSNYYQAGSNVYNPKVATGGVTTGSLSSIYNPSQYNFQGTNLAEKTAAAQARATKKLANQANKLLSTSYNTKIQ